MATNKGIFLAALTLGLCIILASVITGGALGKAGKSKSSRDCQMSGERGDGDEREFRGNREEREDDGERGFRGNREEREDDDEREFRGNREEREDGEEREFRGSRAGREDDDEREDRGGQHGFRHGGGGSAVTAPTGNGYLFN